jgi:Ca-activated chloride channel family protein
MCAFAQEQETNELSRNTIGAITVNQLAQDFNEVKIDEVKSGQLLFRKVGSNRFFQAPQLKTKTDIHINGIVANTHVQQEFTNTSDQWQHAVYVFPLPEDSAVNQLKIKLADREIIGEVQEKQQAKRTFNKAKKEGRKAALLEQYRPNLFTMQVANIPPHQTIKVELTYFQQVKVEDNQFSLHFPMAITPRYTPKGEGFEPLPLMAYIKNSTAKVDKGQHEEINKQQVDNQRLSVPEIDLNITLDSGSKLKKIKSLYHSVMVTRHKNRLYQLNLTDQQMDRDFKLVWQYQENVLPQVLNFQQQFNDEYYGLLMVLPGINKPETKQARELTFVLDTSGSMSGDSLSQAKQAFRHALLTLTDKDTFQLITFNSYASKFFSAPEMANYENKQLVWRHVSKLEANGGTEISMALDLVFNPKSIEENNSLENSTLDKLQQVVFLTDGAVGNEAEIFREIRNKIGNKKLFTVGLGTAPNRYFMTKAAEAGRGSYQFIGSHKQLVPQMDKLFTKLSNPALTDIKFSLTGNDGEPSTAPDPIPDVYAQEPIFLSYKVKGKLTDGLITGKISNEPWSMPITSLLGESATVSQPAELINSIPALATLWARRKISDHYSELMLYRNAEDKQKIIDLALDFNLVTAFTSLVAVEKVISHSENTKVQMKQLKSQLPAGQGMPKTALNWKLPFYLSSLLLLIGALSLYYLKDSTTLISNIKRNVK